MDSLKVLDPEGPIREADIVRPPQQVRLVTTAGKKFSLEHTLKAEGADRDRHLVDRLRRDKPPRAEAARGNWMVGD
jgi:hypothetical protein